MLPKLDRAELSQRFGRQASDLVVQIASLLQGGALSAAAFSLISILQTNDDIAIRVMLWFVSLVLSMVMFVRLCTRSMFQTRVGSEALIVLPLLCLLEVILFAILSTSGLGVEGWRYWYVAGIFLFLAGVLANVLSLRTMKADQFAEDTAAVFAMLQTAIRRDALEGIGGAAVTGAFGLLLFAMPIGWRYTTLAVSIHLAATIIAGGALLKNATSEAEAFRDA